ncbi:MAG: kynureninase [Synergistaceae bacterium]|nr:kynureninase [Synergistaceae bacterium]
MGKFEEMRAKAEFLDARDSLRTFRERFVIPQGRIYMDGNSLGLPPRESIEGVLRVLDEWKTLNIDGWLEGRIPWFTLPEEMGRRMAPLVGALPEEVVMSGSTTSNLHSLVLTFYQPEGKRRKILADELNFPSDLYALESEIRLKGGDPAEDLVLARSRDGSTLEESDLIGLMYDTVSVALLPSVLYRSGQLLDMERLTRAAHEKGIFIGFDCAHSAGSVPHRLHDWDVDFAFWCSYKHLNGGPGSPAFLFLNERHFGREPGLAGWFGYVKDRQFDMKIDFEHAKSAGGWQLGTPSVLSAATLEAALKIQEEAGIDRIREKSLQLTDFLIELVDGFLSGQPYGYSVATPREHGRRGGHLAIEHAAEAWRICCALKARGIVPDFRPPSVIRVAPVALYNTFSEVWEVARALKEIIESREYERFPKERSAVS